MRIDFSFPSRDTSCFAIVYLPVAGKPLIHTSGAAAIVTALADLGANERFAVMVCAVSIRNDVLVVGKRCLEKSTSRRVR